MAGTNKFMTSLIGERETLSKGAKVQFGKIEIWEKFHINMKITQAKCCSSSLLISMINLLSSLLIVMSYIHQALAVNTVQFKS